MKNKIWDSQKGEFVDASEKMADFLNEIEETCKKYGLSISHEDGHGAFLIEEYDSNNIERLKGSHKNYDEDNPYKGKF